VPFEPFHKSRIEQSIVACFSAQVGRTPNRTAVSDMGRNCSYRDLDDRSNQIAHAILAERGEGQEPVGSLLDQGYAPVAAILGALKAG
jgi:fengycin family lipopeptide synthetase D